MMTRIRADIISDTCGDEVKIDCRGTDESDFLPPKQFVLPDAVGLATHSVRLVSIR